MSNPSNDIFLSHASEDKNSFARALADELIRLGLRVFYDEYSLSVGDSLRQKIDEGLATSDYAVVILSHAFFAKSWTKAELNALFVLEMQGKKEILPVWHHVNADDVARYSPLIADKLGLSSDAGVVVVAAALFKTVRKDSGSASAASPSTPVSHAIPFLASKAGRFQVDLGKRHRRLREDILQINLRQMANFYGFERVAQLEAYERGDDELPTGSMKRLCEFFFISRSYLEDGDTEVFDSFDNICNAHDCTDLLNRGFDPYLLCSNQDRHQLWAWPVFHKEEEGFDRIVRGQDCGYFASTGGGKSNLMHLIKAVQMHGKDAYEVQIQLVDQKVWKDLETGTFYRKGMYPFRGPDNEAQDCFFAWFAEYKAKPDFW